MDNDTSKDLLERWDAAWRDAPPDLTRGDHGTDALLRFVPSPPTRHVMELASGGAGTLLSLAAQGWHCTAVDLSSAACALAARRARERGVPLRVLRRDMRDSELPTASLVLLRGGMLGIFPTRKANAQVLAAASSALTKDGFLYLEVYDWEHASRNGIEGRFYLDSSTGVFKDPTGAEPAAGRLYRESELREDLSLHKLEFLKKSTWDGDQHLVGAGWRILARKR